MYLYFFDMILKKSNWFKYIRSNKSYERRTTARTYRYAISY